MNLAGRRTKWLVLVLWLVLFVGGAGLAGKLQGVTKDTASAYLPGRAEATKVVNLQQKVTKEDTTLAVIAYESSSMITAADLARARADVANVAKVKNVLQVMGPVESKDGRALESLAQIKGEGTTVVNGVTDIRSALKRGPPTAGLSVYVTGPAGSQTDAVKIYSSIDGVLLLVTLAVVIVILLLTYRSPFLWLVPLFSVIVALVLAEGVIYLFAKSGLTVNSLSSAILGVLVFGVGTDYALLTIARYREELHRHQDKHEAMHEATRRAGPAILASGSTVAISLLCMLFAEMNSTRGLGAVCAIGVVCALAAMTTFLPALLTALPRGVFWPAVPRYSASSTTLEAEHGVWSKMARFVGGRSRVIWIGTALLLCVAMLGLTALRIGSVPSKDEFTGTPESISGEAAVARHFPAGSGSPAVVIGNASASSAIREVISRTPGVASAGSPIVGSGYVEYQATLSNAPDSTAAYATIDRLRGALHGVGDSKVGGVTAINLDTERAAKHDNKLIIPIVLVVVFLILTLLLRAIVAPLLLMATVILSFGASLGVSALFFAHVFNFWGEDSAMPLDVFIFLVALGVDYNIFLMTRVREEAVKIGTRRGLLRGLAVTGGVITSAGFVLAATFAALCTLPTTGTIEMGFAVAFGVLLDTLVVRTLLVPALAFDIGRRIWWPSGLAKSRPAEVEDRKVRMVV